MKKILLLIVVLLAVSCKYEPATYKVTYTNGDTELVKLDPPYFDGPNKRELYGATVSTTGIARPVYDIIDDWELPTLQWYRQIQRTCRYYIIWGANYYDFIGAPFATPRRHELEAFIKANPKGWIVWDKCNGKTSFNDYELAYTNLPIDTVVYKFMWNGMQQGKSVKEGHIMRGDKRKNEKRIHVTQKPILLYLWQYQTFAKPGWKILDTHLGSGSSRIAADMMQLPFTGIEITKSIYLKQERRYQEYKSQLQLAV